jgi:hypothetical protein
MRIAGLEIDEGSMYSDEDLTRRKKNKRKKRAKRDEKESRKKQQKN